MDEAFLTARDARCRIAIETELERLRNEAEYHEHVRRETLARLEKVLRAVQHGYWWELQGLLSAADIESLSRVEPAPPASLLED